MNIPPHSLPPSRSRRGLPVPGDLLRRPRLRRGQIRGRASELAGVTARLILEAEAAGPIDLADPIDPPGERSDPTSPSAAAGRPRKSSSCFLLYSC